MRGHLERVRVEGGPSLALVPTMGALHEGHLSLVRIALGRSDLVAVSIFVNPMQFGPGEDFAKYPRDIESDLDLLSDEGVGIVFAPESDAELYHEGFCTSVACRSLVEDRLCGRFRPGHFEGVATVCTVLFMMFRPDIAVFGQKDAQQLALVRRIAKDLRLGVEVVAGPIVRETDGLAMSSRNRYLSAEERRQAPAIYRGLARAGELAAGGETRSRVLLEGARSVIEAGGDLIRLQYLELVDPMTMETMRELDREGLLAVAAHVGPTRLIDNALLTPAPR
ncbi:pantoate--beta-alanine ligase [Candidatus Fermentibacterales bacterium]|nr:pantoate--beta-alanine ligase [Candidatus Fermentibacterales bacterium]